MPDFDLIRDVSDTLSHVLADGLAGTFLAGTIVRVDNLADWPSTDPPQLTISLYEVAEDPSLRDQPWGDVDGTFDGRKPPMSMLLRYVITAWAGDAATEQSLLGRALQVLHEGAILAGPQLQGSLAGTDSRVKVTLAPLTLEEKLHIWQAIQKPYRLSLYYEVRVIDLEPT